MSRSSVDDARDGERSGRSFGAAIQREPSVASDGGAPSGPREKSPERPVSTTDGHAMQEQDERESLEEEPVEKKPPIYRRPVFWIVLILVVLAGIAAVLLWLFDFRYKVTTDDAFIAAHISTVSARVAGHVDRVVVDDNQFVKKGDLLVVLDERDLAQSVKSAQAGFENAQAQLQQANATLAAGKATVAQAQADVVSAEASARQAEADRDRYRQLQKADPRAVSPQQIDQAEASARTTAAQLASANEKQLAAEAQVKVAQAQIVAAQAMIDKAKSDLENAQLQLSYARVYAPDDGQVTGRSVEVGNYIAPGQALMLLVPRDVYVVANYKETQLKNVRVGNRAKIHVDAFDIDLWGKVQSIQGGSGAAFSLLPPENATGNYVKVVQRIPVKITFDQLPEQRLSPGMSVGPTIYLKK